MKIYLKQNVLEKALERINYIFDEFENVIVAFSGGKDSTVCFHLALQVAKERGRLPLKVFFIDQEGEWQATVDYVKSIMYREDVDPFWFQIPMRMANTTSPTEIYLQIWEEGGEWLREKDPISYKENVYGTPVFAELFERIKDHHWGDLKTCLISGIRVEESPTRLLAMVEPAYKHIPWGKRRKNPKHVNLYPLYDWTYRDIWKAIHDHKWPYCRLYDYMYRYGVPVRDMRVSNVHHSTAIRSLFMMQEIEPQTWEKLTARLGGVNTAGQTQKDLFVAPKKLPHMFDTWDEYANHLLKYIITEKDMRDRIRKKLNTRDRKYLTGNPMIEKTYNHVKINTILMHDFYFTKMANFETDQLVVSWRKYCRYGTKPPFKNKYVDEERRLGIVRRFDGSGL